MFILYSSSLLSWFCLLCSLCSFLPNILSLQVIVWLNSSFILLKYLFRHHPWSPTLVNCVSLSCNYFITAPSFSWWPLLLFEIIVFIYLLTWLYWLECFMKVEILSLFCTTISTNIGYPFKYLAPTRCTVFLEWMNNLQACAVEQSIYSMQWEEKENILIEHILCVLEPHRSYLI